MSDQQTAAPAPSNAQQAMAWDGDEGRYWAAHADRFDESLRAYQPTFLAAAGLRPHDRVLDVGCGAGETSIEAAKVVTAGSVLGVDLSGAMLEVAVRRAAAAGLSNVRFVRADAQVHPFAPASFDVAIGRTSAMFFGDPVAAFKNLAVALRPGGRLVLLVWQGIEHNEWIRCIIGAMAAGRDLAPPPPGAPGPFALSEPSRVRSLLTGAGFDEPGLRDLEERMYFGPTPEEATTFIHGLNAWMLRDLDEAGRARAVDALHQTMREHHGPDGVTFNSATWLITAARS